MSGKKVVNNNPIPAIIIITLKTASFFGFLIFILIIIRQVLQGEALQKLNGYFNKNFLTDLYYFSSGESLQWVFGNFVIYVNCSMDH